MFCIRRKRTGDFLSVDLDFTRDKRKIKWFDAYIYASQSAAKLTIEVSLVTSLELLAEVLDELDNIKGSCVDIPQGMSEPVEEQHDGNYN